MKSVYGISEIPVSVSSVFVIFSFLLTISPYLSGTDWGIFKIPTLNNKLKRIFRIIGPVLLVISIAFYLPVIPIHGQSVKTMDAFGLRLKSVHWDNQYQINEKDKDFVGTITYDVECTSPYRVGELLTGDAIWFGHGIKYNVRGKVIEPNPQAYTLNIVDSHRETIAQQFKGDSTKATHIFWNPKISPPLKKKDQLKYQVIIETKNSEAAAFRKEGSFAGMRTRFPTEQLSMRVRAPHGKKIALNDYFARDTSGEKVPLGDKHSKPRKELGNHEITWTVKYPIPSISYIVSLSISDP